MYYTTKNSTGSTPQSRQANVIEGILMGGKETNAFKARSVGESTKPKNMVAKLDILILNTSSELLRGQAIHAKELLLLLPHDEPANESNRRRIFDFVNELQLP